MAVTYEDVIPSLIENTTMRKSFLNGVPRTYGIKANEGYVLHDNTLDGEAFDENGESLGIVLGYAVGEKSCSVNYDFEANPREFYAVLRSDVPENQIFGGGNNDGHEVM